MARSKCRPCITISTIWKIGKIHFKHFIEDIRAFNEVQEYSCTIHYSENSLIPSSELKTVKKIREIAATNYNPNVAKIQEVENEINQILKENT